MSAPNPLYNDPKRKSLTHYIITVEAELKVYIRHNKRGLLFDLLYNIQKVGGYAPIEMRDVNHDNIMIDLALHNFVQGAFTLAATGQQQHRNHGGRA